MRIGHILLVTTDGVDIRLPSARDPPFPVPGSPMPFLSPSLLLSETRRPTAPGTTHCPLPYHGVQNTVATPDKQQVHLPRKHHLSQQGWDGKPVCPPSLIISWAGNNPNSEVFRGTFWEMTSPLRSRTNEGTTDNLHIHAHQQGVSSTGLSATSGHT